MAVQRLPQLPGQSSGWDGGVGGRGGEEPSTWIAGLIVAWVESWAGQLWMCGIRGREEPGLSCRSVLQPHTRREGDPECHRSVSDPKERFFLIMML